MRTGVPLPSTGSTSVQPGGEPALARADAGGTGALRDPAQLARVDPFGGAEPREARLVFEHDDAIARQELADLARRPIGCFAHCDASTRHVRDCPADLREH